LSFLVTGASGLIGTHLVRRLAQTGKPVVALDLKPPRETLAGVTYVTADVRDLSWIDPAGGIETIYNFAAVHTTPGHPEHEYYDTNVDGALAVCALARRLDVRSIVFTSSISVYGPSEDRRVETGPPAHVSAYGKSKLMAQRIHRLWQQEDAARRLVTLRPAVVFGQGEGGNFARMAALLKKGFLVFPGRRDTVKSCIFVEGLLNLMAFAQGRNEGQVVANGAYPECPTLEQIVVALQTRFFPKARLIDVPTELVVAAARMARFAGTAGLGVHPDRIYKLLRSTNVYAEWAVEHQALTGRTMAGGLERLAASTQGSFV
jgi:nucleoside-diphosphate-sugar epimerase